MKVQTLTLGIIIWIVVISVLLTCGCIEKPIGNVVSGPQTKYVCQDGRVVSSPGLCSAEKTTGTLTGRNEATTTIRKRAAATTLCSPHVTVHATSPENEYQDMDVDLGSPSLWDKIPKRTPKTIGFDLIAENTGNCMARNVRVAYKIKDKEEGGNVLQRGTIRFGSIDSGKSRSEHVTFELGGLVAVNELVRAAKGERDLYIITDVDWE